MTVFAVIAVLVAASPSTAVLAQSLEENTFSTPNGSYTVEWTDAWTPDLSDDDEFSTMLMLDSQITIYSVMFIHDANTGLTTRAVYYSLSGVMISSFEGDVTSTVEWQGEDDSFHGAHVITLSGIDFLLYMRVDPPIDGNNGPVIQLAAAPRAAFPSSIETLKNEVTLNGEPVLDGVTGQDVLDQLETSAPSTDAGSSDLAAPQTATESESNPADSDQSSTRSRSSILDRIAQPPASNETPESSGVETYANSNPEYTVTYPNAWVDMSITDATVGQFSVALDSRTSAIVSFTGRTTTETNREAYFDDLIARESRLPGFVGSVKTDDRLTTATWTSDTELAVLEYIFVDDTTVVTVMVTVQSPRPEVIMDQVQMIALNGEPILPNWTDLWSNQE